jgi:transcriptional regulator with XRE-family HTH domain
MSHQVEPEIGLAQAIRRLRTERGMSQEELGHEAGVHPTWISHIESGRVSPKWENLKRIAAVLGVRSWELAFLVEELEVEYGTAPQPGQSAGGQ